MPYISKVNRQRLTPQVVPESAGELSYSISQLIKRFLENGDDVNFQKHAMVVGVLYSLAFEYQRRILSPYEDSKIEENGDVW
jgi:hypothetical protein